MQPFGLDRQAVELVPVRMKRLRQRPVGEVVAERARLAARF